MKPTRHRGNCRCPICPSTVDKLELSLCCCHRLPHEASGWRSGASASMAYADVILSETSARQLRRRSSLSCVTVGPSRKAPGAAKPGAFADLSKVSSNTNSSTTFANPFSRLRRIAIRRLLVKIVPVCRREGAPLVQWVCKAWEIYRTPRLSAVALWVDGGPPDLGGSGRSCLRM